MPGAGVGTADDRIYVIPDLNAPTPAVLTIPVPYVFNYGAGRPVVLPGDLVVVATYGEDGFETTGDDTLVLIGDPAGEYTKTPIVVGPLDEDGECRPTVLTPTSLVVPTFIETGNIEYSTTGFSLVTNVGTENDVLNMPLPGMMGGVSGLPLRLSSTAILVANGGPDGTSGQADDAVTLVTALDGGLPSTASVLAGGGVENAYMLGYSPVLLGDRRAAHLSSGPDAKLSAGGDGLARVIDGLPTTNRLAVAKLKISFDAGNPAKGEKVSLSGSVQFDSVVPFGSLPVTISVGNVAQTIATDQLVAKKGKWSYKAPKGAPGVIRSFSYDSVKGTFKISGAGLDTGLATLDPGYVPVAFEFGDTWLGVALEGTGGPKGISYTEEK